MIRLSLITPEKVVFKDEADSVSLPTTTGQIQILGTHMPLVSTLAPGELVIRKQGGAGGGGVGTADGTLEVVHFAVSSGYIEVRPGGEVVVLANTAETALEIDIERAEAARARAKELLKGKVVSGEEYATALAAIEKEWARARVGRKHLSKRRPMGV